MKNNIPFSLKDTSRGIESIPLVTELYSDRKVFLTDTIDEENVTSVLMQLMWLEKQDAAAPVTMFINSPGGSVRDGLALYEYIRGMKTPVTAVCYGTTASMGSIIYLAADDRQIFRYGEIMIHDPMQYSGKNYEKPAELSERLDGLLKTRDMLTSIIAERTGHDTETILNYTAKDSFFDAESAIEFGLAHKIYNANIN